MTGTVGAVVLKMFCALVGLLAVLFLMARMKGKDHRPYAAMAGMWIVLIDQLVKVQTADRLALGETVDVLPPLVRLCRVHNYGAAWSSFSGARWLLVAVTAVGMGLLVWLLIRVVRHPLGVWSVSCIVAGGVGNLIDRVRLGYVEDMLEFMFFDFPVFNVADIFVTCGTVLAAVYYLRYYDRCDAKNWGKKHLGTDPSDDGE